MAVAGIPFDLLAVKLAAPATRPGTVAKTDLIARMCTSRSPFATIVAPVGYGKTTLLAGWAAADPRPFAWVTLDGRDDDPVLFLRYVAAALHGVEPVPPEVFDALSGPGGFAWTKRLPRLGNAFAAIDRPLVLVLDDLHAVTNPSCLDVLAALFDYVPAGSRIVVASREAPALPLARWRTQALVDEIGVAELRFDEQEAELLLRAAGVDIDGSELAKLIERTEGWAAGLYLAALSLQAAAPSSVRPARLTGDDRFVSDYFRLELLSHLPEAEAQFLKRTSVLDRMTGGLCDAVLHTTQSADMLALLERRNCFLVALDRRGEWYRYHRLFGELLRTELERTEPDAVAALNSRAMGWCIANDLTVAAVAYGHAAGETDTVAGLVDALALPLYNDGCMETLEEWLGWFREDELRRYPALAVVGAWLRALTGRQPEAERLLMLAEGATSAIPLSDGSESIEPWVATLRACMMRNGAEQALGDADFALSRFSRQSGWQPAALVIRGSTHALLDMVDRATDDLGAAVDSGLARGSPDVVFLALAQLALLAAGHGAWGEAREKAQAAQELVDDTGLGDYSTSALVHVTTARVALHEARVQDARAALTCAHRLRPLLDHSIPWLAVQVGLELARAHLALADVGAARTVLSEAERVLQLRPDMGSLASQARELHEQLAATAGSQGGWAMSLTGAELRLLPYLATHLTFSEIASRLFVSRNTVKTEAVAIYRKFGVSSRSDAIARAIEIGLLDGSIYPPRADLILEG